MSKKNMQKKDEEDLKEKDSEEEKNLEEEEDSEEEPESIISEPPEINSRINHFLANPWKVNSLWEIGNSSPKTLEDLVPKKEDIGKQEESFIDYNKKREDQEKYLNSLNFVKTENPTISKERKDLIEQERLYKKFQPEDKEPGEEYISSIDMKKEYKFIKDDIR